MNRFKKIIFIAFGFTLVGSLLIGGVTAAVFTDSSEKLQNAFASGEFRIELDRPNAVPYFNLANIAPGDSGSQEITVANAGSVMMDYVVDLQLSGGLAEGPHPLALELTAVDGERISLDTGRSLNAGEEEILILSWYMPEEAGNRYQNAKATLAITVQAEQAAGR